MSEERIDRCCDTETPSERGRVESGSMKPYAAARALALTLVAIVGCDCDDDPGDECVSTTECPLDQVCVDGTCQRPTDGGPGVDGGGGEDDAGTTDGGPIPTDMGSDLGGCVSVECRATEDCFDGLDNDCDDTIDEGCSCLPGSTSRCLPPGTTPSSSLCAWGEMTCVGAAEFGEWDECTGAGMGMGDELYGCRRIGIMGAPGALASSNFQAWLETQGAIATRFHQTSDAAELQRAELETFDLVVVDWLQRLYTEAEAETLAQWVNDGGGLMVMTGHDSGATADRHVSLLTALGPTYDLPAGPLNGPAVLVLHPTTMNMDGTDVLPPITFNGGLRTVVPDELSATIVPMAMIGDQVVGVAGPLGDGQVLLFGDEWIEFDSEWSTMPAIPQFWLNVVTWLAPDTTLDFCE